MVIAIQSKKKIKEKILSNDRSLKFKYVPTKSVQLQLQRVFTIFLDIFPL